MRIQNAVERYVNVHGLVMIRMMLSLKIINELRMFNILIKTLKMLLRQRIIFTII